MNKPVIGIVGTYNLTNEDNDPYKDNAYFVSMYYDLITKSGGIPVGLLDRNNVLEYLDLCDGYLWPGGGCIQRGYNVIFEDAIKNHKPILGICLGMQAIATYFNVVEDMATTHLDYEATYQKNKNEILYLKRLENNIVANHDHYVTKDEASIHQALHKVVIKENSELFKLYQTDQIYEPSMHTVVVAIVPKCLNVVANSLDGVIEGLEYNDYNIKILGVQYHPELINDDKLFKWLINNACKDNKKS